MKRYERAAAVVLCAIGAAAAVMAWQMGFGSARFPGPGYLPFWLAALLAATSVLYFLGNLGGDADRRPLWERGAWTRPALSAGVMLLFTLLIAWLGFFASTFLLFLAWLILIERERWIVVGAVSVLGTFGAYLLFSVLLQVPLPKGLLF